MTLQKVLYLFMVIFMSGCASSPKSFVSSAPPDKSKEIAVLFGQGGGVGGFFSEMLVPIGTKKDIDILKVNGKDLESPANAGHREYWLEPGKHEIEVRCKITMGSNIHAHGREVIVAELKEDNVYYLDGQVIIKKNDPSDGILKNMFRSNYYCKPIIRYVNDN